MENEIIKAFLYNDALKFNEIEKFTGLRSNKLAYHLRNFTDKGLIVKKEESYSLSDNFEHIIPYVSDNQAVLPVVLIAIGQKNNFFLPVREKKPYKDFLGLPAGRILVGEKIEDAVIRIMKNKYKADVTLKKINSVSLEHVRKKEKIVHSFLLILVSASTKDDLEYVDIEKNKTKIIPSDYWLLKNHHNKKFEIKTIQSDI